MAPAVEAGSVDQMKCPAADAGPSCSTKIRRFSAVCTLVGSELSRGGPCFYYHAYRLPPVILAQVRLLNGLFLRGFDGGSRCSPAAGDFFASRGKHPRLLMLKVYVFEVLFIIQLHRILQQDVPCTRLRPGHFAFTM